MERMLIRLLITLLAILPAAISSCSSSEPEPEPEPSGLDRTVLVYMVADNNLGSYYHVDDNNIAQMEAAALAGKLNGGLSVPRQKNASAPAPGKIKKP